MAQVSISGVDHIKEMLAALHGDLNKANDRAQNAMAYEVWRKEKDQMRIDIDRPTPWTLNAPRYKKSGQSVSEISEVSGAAVYMADFFHPGAAVAGKQYLGVQVLGGETAGPRASEKILQQFHLMPKNYTWVPASAVVRNQYGNVNGGAILAMVMDLTKRGSKGKNFAVLGKYPNQKGVLTRIGDQWVPFIWFVKPESYKPGYEFYESGERTVSTYWLKIWEKEIDRALKSKSK